MEFVAQAIQGGEGTVLLPWLVRLLPGMLKIQRLIPSELQAVSMAARKAVSLLKYLPLMQPALVKSVLATLVQVRRGGGFGCRVMAMPDQRPGWAMGITKWSRTVPPVIPRRDHSQRDPSPRALDTAFSASPHTS